MISGKELHVALGALRRMELKDRRPDEKTTEDGR